MLNTIWIIFFLIICTITDTRERKINILFCLINQIGMITIHIFCHDFSLYHVVEAAILSGFFYIVSKISKGGIGMGDVFMIMTIGMVCGMAYTVEILLWSFAICIIFSIAGMVSGKLTLKSKLPLAPFMLTGVILMKVLGGNI